ncbi:MAG: DUF1905 domain-containing protein [Flavobacteriales bacterium]|nr:DUF1905 domain-containing protein [Flavobacteriales bacterium]
MAKPKRTIVFTAPMEKMSGQFAWSYLEFPHDVEQLFGRRGNVRVKGTINGVPVDRALMPTKSGYHIIILGSDLRRAAKLKKAGDLAQVEVWLNTEPTKLELPEELAETLDFLPEMKVAWDQLNPGMRRSMCYWVGSAKTVATRAKRVAELLLRLETGYFTTGVSKRNVDRKK